MFKKLAFITLIAAGIASADPDCQYHYRISNRTADIVDNLAIFAPGPTISINNQNNGCVGWAFSYSSEGFSALSIQLESAPTTSSYKVAGTFAAFAGSTVSGSNPSTSTTSSTFVGSGYYPWIRLNVY